MNAIKEHFQTDWSAMTFNDWFGLIVTIVIFALMIALYFYVLHPSNREKLEAQRYIPLDDDDNMLTHPQSPSITLNHPQAKKEGGTSNE